MLDKFAYMLVVVVASTVQALSSSLIQMCLLLHFRLQSRVVHARAPRVPCSCTPRACLRVYG